MHYFNLREYEINTYTMALLPGYQIEYGTKAIDAVHGEIYLRETVLELIKRACLKGGSTYEGRKKYTEYQLEINQKVPLAIDPIEEIYVFPTTSSKLPNCAWIFANHIQSTKANGKTSIITFRNGYNLEVDISHLILSRQRQKAALLYQSFALKKQHY